MMSKSKKKEKKINVLLIQEKRNGKLFTKNVQNMSNESCKKYVENVSIFNTIIQ